MFALRTVFRNSNRKTLANCICTSSVTNKNKSQKSIRPRSNSEDSSSKTVGRSEKVGELNSRTTEGEIKPKQTPRKRPGEADFKTDLFRKVLVSSAEKVAKDIGGDEKTIQKDLLEYIKTFKVLKKEDNLNELERRRKDFDSKTQMRHYRSSDFPMEKTTGSGIFSENIMHHTHDQVELKTWDSLAEEDLKIRSQVAPRNHFEELMQWTNEGKLWHFPINNDQGLEEEAKVSFTEHVFLERHLEPWCPKKGPLRKFMELVLIGLSKNPYFTVEEKKEHIKWFEKYFETKKKLLQELGAVGATKELEGSRKEPPGQK